MAYVLDKNQSVIMQISNDTFFYIKEDEEPLDDESFEEINRIMKMFPNGLIINDNWEYIKNKPNAVQVTIIPYIEEQQDWDGCIPIFNHGVCKFKIENAKFAYVQNYNEKTGKTSIKQKASIEYFYGKPWLCYPIESKSRSMIPMWKNLTILNREAFDNIEGINT